SSRSVCRSVPRAVPSGRKSSPHGTDRCLATTSTAAWPSPVRSLGEGDGLGSRGGAPFWSGGGLPKVHPPSRVAAAASTATSRPAAILAGVTGTAYPLKCWRPLRRRGALRAPRPGPGAASVRLGRAPAARSWTLVPPSGGGRVQDLRVGRGPDAACASGPGRGYRMSRCAARSARSARRQVVRRRLARRERGAPGPARRRPAQLVLPDRAGCRDTHGTGRTRYPEGRPPARVPAAGRAAGAQRQGDARHRPGEALHDHDGGRRRGRGLLRGPAVLQGQAALVSRLRRGTQLPVLHRRRRTPPHHPNAMRLETVRFVVDDEAHADYHRAVWLLADALAV